MTVQSSSRQEHFAILLLASDDRGTLLEAQLGLLLPRATVERIDADVLADGSLPEVDAALIDGGSEPRGPIEALRLLRARGFVGPIVVVTAAPDDSALRTAVQSLGAVVVSRSAADAVPTELASGLAQAASENTVRAEVAYARRVFAAGQVALSLQHSINNPLAALLAEAQLLQLEELPAEQRGSVDRMVELCRRIVALVRRLDALGTSG